MSGWGKALGGWASGRFSPFGRPGQGDDHQVTDQDFSYITSDDLDDQHDARRTTAAHSQRRNDGHNQAHHDHHHTRKPYSGPPRPQRDTDVILFRHKRVSYPVHFASYSIDDGDLSVGTARDQAAKKLDVRDPRRVKMFYKGKTLKDDGRACCDEGMRSEGAATEVLCVVSEANDDNDSGSESGASQDAGDRQQADGSTRKKKRKPRKKKNTRRADDSGTSSPAPHIVEHLPIPSGAHPRDREGSSTGTSRAQSPQVPQSAMAKLSAIENKFRTDFLAGCKSFCESTPADKKARDFEHKRLSETILTQILLKLDGVETEGDNDARSKRKEVVKEVQGWLNQMDAIVK